MIIVENLNLGKIIIQDEIVKFKEFKLIKKIGFNKTGHWEINKNDDIAMYCIAF